MIERVDRKKKKRKQRRRVIILTFLFVLSVTLVLGYKMMELEAEKAELQKKYEQVEAQYETEQGRTQELQEEKNFRKTMKYIEQLAREKFGLVHEGEVILVPKEQE